METATPNPAPSVTSRSLRIGFLALTDAAPLIVAEERGLFARHGLRVQLSREVGWATLRDKIIYGELDAAQAPAPMLWSTRLGLDCVPCSVLTSFILSLNGNAITLSEKLWQTGVRNAATLRDEARRRSGERKLTFGVVSIFSSHHLMIRSWLQSGGINPDRDVRIVVVPPAQMFRNLSAGTIDGYCAGEPWNTLAVRERAGWCPAWSASLHPGHIEKVLMLTERFATNRANEHAALLAALSEAAAWCDEPAHREPLANLLSRSSYINQSARIIAPALVGTFDCGHGRAETVPDFHIFHAGNANHPSTAKAVALQAELVAAGLIPGGSATNILPSTLFREDFYNHAIRTNTSNELVSR